VTVTENGQTGWPQRFGLNNLFHLVYPSFKEKEPGIRPGSYDKKSNHVELVVKRIEVFSN